MTEPTALSNLRHLYQNMVNGAVRDTASAKRIAEGLLAPAIEALERGTPPAVAWKHDCSALLTNDVELWTNACPHCGKPRTPTQPAQPQAGAVPLTVDEVEQLIAQWSYELHGDRARYLVRMTEQHYGIKGGQHGTE